MATKLVVKDLSSLYTKFTIKPSQVTKRITSDFLIANAIILFIFFKINPLPWKMHVHEEPNIKLLLSFFALTAVNLLLVVVKGNRVVKESLMVIKKIGVQIERRKLNGSRERHFVDISKIRDLVVYETMNPYDINYNMSLIVRGNDKLLIIFESFKLNLESLLQVYYQARKLLNLEPTNL